MRIGPGHHGRGRQLTAAELREQHERMEHAKAIDDKVAELRGTCPREVVERSTLRTYAHAVVRSSEWVDRVDRPTAWGVLEAQKSLRGNPDESKILSYLAQSSKTTHDHRGVKLHDGTSVVCLNASNSVEVTAAGQAPLTLPGAYLGLPCEPEMDSGLRTNLTVRADHKTLEVTPKGTIILLDDKHTVQETPGCRVREEIPAQFDSITWMLSGSRFPAGAMQVPRPNAYFIQPDGKVEGFEFRRQEWDDKIEGHSSFITMTRVDGQVGADGSIVLADGMRRVTSPIPLQVFQHAVGTPGESTRGSSERWVEGAREPERAAPLVERAGGSLRIAGISIPVHSS